MNLLNYNSPIMRFLECVFDLLMLNLLTLLLCVPLVTAGGALTALYKTLFDLREQKGSVLSGYWQTFRAEFRPALPLGLLCLLADAAFGAYLFLLYSRLSVGTIWTWVVVIAVGVLFFFPMAYVFALFARYQNTVRKTIANAFFLSIRHLLTTILVLALHLLPALLIWVLPAYSPMIGLAWLFLGISLPAYLASGLFWRVFRQYPQETQSDEETKIT
jgi:uncharacterized membrane protein YesL